MSAEPSFEDSMSVSLESLMQEPPAGAREVTVGMQLVSFLVIGGLAAVSFVVLSSLMVGALPGVPSWIVGAGCYALFILPVYLLHRRFSFRSGAAHRRAVPRYVGVQLSGLVLAAIFSFICYRLIGMPTVVASLLVIGLTSGVNFVVLRLWAFAGSR
jgi:putative flippase GtrA